MNETRSGHFPEFVEFVAFLFSEQPFMRVARPQAHEKRCVPAVGRSRPPDGTFLRQGEAKRRLAAGAHFIFGTAPHAQGTRVCSLG